MIKRQSNILEQIDTLDIENKEKYKKYFNKVPKLVKLLCENYKFNNKKVLDIGSNFGNSLLYWGGESVGIELRKECVEFLNAMGKQIYSVNVEDDFYTLINENFEAIYTNNLLEHLVAPHYFLAQLHTLLQQEGILAIGHPVVPLQPYNFIWKKLGYKGWLACEHINFFTPDTIKLVLERNGFEVIEQYYSPYYIFGANKILGLNTIIKNSSIQVMTIAKKVNYKYCNKRIKEFDPTYTNIFNEYR